MRLLSLIRLLFHLLFPPKKKDQLPTSPSQEVKSSGSDINPLQEPIPIQKEAPWFSRKNNLADEFAYEPVAVYSSNFDNTEPIGYLQADGSIIPTNGNKIVKEEEELLEDDVEFLKDDPNYAKPNNSTNAQYITGVDPYSKEGDSNQSEVNIFKKYEQGDI